VHNGISLAPFERGARGRLREGLAQGSDRPIVLTLARLAPQKGVEYLVEAAARVPDVLFVVAGDGPDREALERKAESCGVKERVLFLGHRQDVPELLESCDLFVLPSLYEGLPVSVLEAMASGRPVIATRIGGTDEAVEDDVNGLLVPPADPIALASAIRRLLADRSLAQRLSARARDRVRREFSSETVAAHTAAIYEELVERA